MLVGQNETFKDDILVFDGYFSQFSEYLFGLTENNLENDRQTNRLIKTVSCNAETQILKMLLKLFKLRPTSQITGSL